MGNKMKSTVLFLATLIAFTVSSDAHFDVINKFVELKEAVGANDNDVSLLVSQVSEAVRDNAEKFARYATSVEHQCGVAKTLFNGFNNKVNATVAQLVSDIRHAGANAERTESEMKKYMEQIKQSQADLKETEEAIHQALDDLGRFGGEAEQKLVIVKSLRDIITDELIAEQKHAPNYQASFVQLETFSTKLKELKGLLNNSKEQSFNAMVSALIEMTEGKGFADQRILEKIMNILGKLSNNLAAFRQRQETDGKQNIANLKAKAESITGMIKNTALLIYGQRTELHIQADTRQNAQNSIRILQKEMKRNIFNFRGLQEVCANQNSFINGQRAFAQGYLGRLKALTDRMLR